jgi:hypothetical protein
VRVDMPSMVVGTIPAGFTEALTGQGEAVSWRVLDDPSAPGGKVIAETSGDNADYRFPLCIFDGFTARDVKASVRFKAVDGSVDQAAGVVARVQDPENYYVTRANALEANVRLYKVTGGVRRQIASYDGEVTARVWHSLSLKVEGDLLEVEFDGAAVIQANDTSISGPGKVGPLDEGRQPHAFLRIRLPLTRGRRGRVAYVNSFKAGARDMSEPTLTLMPDRAHVVASSGLKLTPRRRTPTRLLRGIARWLFAPPKLGAYATVDRSHESAMARAARIRRTQEAVDELFAAPGPEEASFARFWATAC